jgi:uncharacterized protein (UPF0332 family)
MAVTPDAYLRAAIAILGANGASEIDFRSAASRAYYAAYHCAVDLAKDLPVKSVIKGGYHELVIKTLASAGSDPFGRKCARVAYLLSSMRGTREVADYHLDADFPKTDAEYVVAMVPVLTQAAAEALEMRA